MADHTSNRLKTHNELMASTSAVAVNGDWWFLHPTGFPELGYVAKGVNPELRALLSSAHILYKTSVAARDALESVIALLEERGLDEAVQPILAHQAAIEMAIRCAIEGPEKVLRKRQNDR